jgi:hypothetical protein
MTESNLIIAAEHNFKVLRGDNPSCSLQFVDAENVPIDLSAATIIMQARWKPGDVQYVNQWTNGSGIAVSGVDNNIVTITGWDALRAGLLSYDLQINFISGTKTTYLKGTIKVEEDTTR